MSPVLLNRPLPTLTWTPRYILNRQPTLALPFFLRRRRSNVFDLIRDNNLFTAVRDQALLLVEFDLDLEKQQREEAGQIQDLAQSTMSLLPGEEKKRSRSIALLVDHLHSISVGHLARVEIRLRTNFSPITLSSRSLRSFVNFKNDHTIFIFISTHCSTRTHSWLWNTPSDKYVFFNARRFFVLDVHSLASFSVAFGR